MSSYILSCCSTADTSREWAEKRNVFWLPFNFELGGTWYKDDFGKSVPPKELYSRMLAGEDATTSQVATGEYLAFFKSKLKEGLDIIHITLSSGISNTYNSACLAADQLREQYPERTIRVIDALTASPGYGLLVDKLADLRDQGMKASELADWAEEHRHDVNTLFLSSDLRFFVKGGRISKAAGFFGGMLKVCPLMRVANDGSLEVMEKIRTKAKSEERMLQRMKELAQNGVDYNEKVFITNSDCMEDALDVAHAIEAAFPHIDESKIQVFPIGATIGVHTGPGTVALAFWGTPDRW